MPLPFPHVTKPLADLLEQLDAAVSAERTRRDAMITRLHHLLTLPEDPDAVGEVRSITDISSRWPTLAQVEEQVRAEWISDHPEVCHVALAHTLAACTAGFPAWRKAQARLVGEMAEKRVLAGRGAPDFNAMVNEEDRLSGDVEYYDRVWQTCSHDIASFLQTPTAEWFNRSMEKLQSLGSSFPWKA